ncbi:Maltose/maltodextrin ABC transporter, permease protein MalG [Candidatus Rhodobacter oscarellae]|uniref:Maltose/maltodextrin ABC transporter, permease protein MalG n=1 Tax=Candidatus Rhodobacter oscarellae TaxID=1675527 RepID=A0A0J9GV23_9RHOB|nr:carbohydrate ABC transporter permease [Candidatus Rhodobacter lobularis]KMW57428.1 Maltose/maltodextrin ABC transporter, permease protein MalG [Candidatus Rhodobacter lobularis]
MSRMFTWADAARIIVLLAVSFLILMPIAAAVLGGFKTNGELRVSPFGLPEVWHLQFYGEILGGRRFWVYLGNSFFISIMTVGLTLVLGSMCAFAFAQTRFFGSRFLFGYLLLGLMFPVAAAIMPLFLTVRDLGLLDTAWGVILPQVAFGLAFSIMFFRTFFKEMPSELFDAARVDGCSYIRFYFTFTLPLSTPILATIAVFVFVQSWNNYLLPLIMLNDREGYTWTLGAMDFRGEYAAEWNRTLAFVSATLAPAVVFFLAAQKYIVSGLTGGAVKG